MKNLKYQTYKLKYKDFPLEYSLIKGKNTESQLHDYSKDYLTFEAVESGTFRFSNSGLSYSIDGGKTWTEIGKNTDTPTINAGDRIMFKGVLNFIIGGKEGLPMGVGCFSSSNSFNAIGNPYSLLYGDNFVGVKDLTGKNTALELLFRDCQGLISAKNVALPATTLAQSCYSGMFQGCTALTAAPELPATTLVDFCYGGMFNGCTSLTTAPELPVTTLANYCYNSMFSDCTSLTAAPELPATTLAESCYNEMFLGCTSLTTAPELPATTLANSCYDGMFSGCASLNYIKAMFTTTPSYTYTSSWVSGVASSGTFVKNSAATWNVTGDNGIPTGWTVETADVIN